MGNSNVSWFHGDLIILASLNTTGEEDQERYFCFPIDYKQRMTMNSGKFLPPRSVTNAWKGNPQHSSWSTQCRPESFSSFSPHLGVSAKKMMRIEYVMK